MNLAFNIYILFFCLFINSLLLFIFSGKIFMAHFDLSYVSTLFFFVYLVLPIKKKSKHGFLLSLGFFLDDQFSISHEKFFILGQ